MVAVDSAGSAIWQEGGYDSPAIKRVLQADVAIL